MDIEDIVLIGRDALFFIIKLSSPILLISLIIGLIVSIFQTVTSIQEQTLTFVPKMIAVFTGIMLLGYWLLSNIKEYIITLWSSINLFIK